MKHLFSLLFVLLLATGYSQTIAITGKVHSADNDSIVGASVMLIGAQDSILKTYAITDKAGDFKLVGVKSGEYFIKVSFYGFTPADQEVLVTDGDSDRDLGTIVLQPKMLDAVEVKGEYIPIDIKGDTIEYNARAFEVQEHDVVEDLLKQLPGVEVAEDGSITVQGQTVNQVLVDGEKFFGDDATIATKNLPANSVEKVQVYDKTSDMSEFTGVDDGSESPTINLKLKEDHKRGSFGNFELAGGTEYPITSDEPLYQAKANVFSFNKKWQFSVIGMSNNINQTGFTYKDYSTFMGGAQTWGRGGGDVSGLNLNDGGPDDGFLTTNATGVNLTYKPSDRTTVTSSFFFNNFDKNFNKVLDRETYFTDSTLLTNEIADQNSNSLNGRADISLEQTFDSTHYLTIRFTGDIGETVYYNDNSINNSTDENILVSSFNTSLEQTDFNYSFSSSANYRKKFAKNGRFTGFDISYDKSNKDLTTYLDYLNTLVVGGVPFDYLISQNQFSVETTDDLDGNWTWSEPITGNSLLQFDLGVNRKGSGRERTVYDDVSGESILNTILSGDGDYYQMHYNGKLTHKWFGSKVNTNLGMDYKYLNLIGADIFTAPKEFHYVLPNLRIEWDPNKKSNLRMRYTTSITAPSLNQLQPLLDNTNPSSVIVGNINLEPEYRHSLNLRFRSFNQYNFTFFMASITGNYTENNIIYSQNINEFYITELTPENIGHEKSINGYIVYGTSVHPLKTRFHISSSGTVSNGLINLNGTRDSYVTYSFSPTLRFDNIGKRIFDFRTGIGYNYSLNTYEDNPEFNNSYQNINYYVNLTIKIKDRWEINPNVRHYFYPDFETNNEIMLIDFYIGCNLLESRQLQVFVSGKDMLNQNTGISQYYLQNMYEQEVTQTLGRYFMVGAKYSFKKLGQAKKKKTD